MEHEAFGGILLIAATLLAMIIENSPADFLYDTFYDRKCWLALLLPLPFDNYSLPNAHGANILLINIL